MQIMTLKKSLLTYHPKPKTLFHMQTWKEPTNLFTDVWCRSSVALYPLASLLLPKTILQSRQNTTHACYFSTRGLEIKHKSNKTYKTHALGWEKYSFINLKMNQLTIIIEIGHRSLILILGSSSSLSSNCFA
jgi:hypothetical protein